MANYLERVASSASRRAAIARPPNSGPPVLPPGKDLSPAIDDPFASDQDQFLDPVETPAPAPALSAEIKSETTEESETAPAQTPKSVSSAAPKPRPPHERLTSQAPFTFSVPRTLRPINTANEPPREHAATPVESADTDINEVTAAPVTTVRPEPLVVTEPTEEHQAPTPRPVHTPVHTEATAPLPQVERIDGPPRQQIVAEPSPPSALPVHVPPVAGTTPRPEQSRITIGSLEVLVNNHPRVTPARPAPAPSRSESLNLEKRYLDRFRLRH